MFPVPNLQECQRLLYVVPSYKCAIRFIQELGRCDVEAIFTTNWLEKEQLQALLWTLINL